MRRTMTRKWPSIGLALDVADETGQVVMRVVEQKLSLRDTLHLRSADDQELGQLVADAIGGGYTLFVAGQAAVHLGPGARPEVRGLAGHGDLRFRGDKRRFTLRAGRKPLAKASRRFLSLRPSYRLEIVEPTVEALAVGIAAGLLRLAERKD